MFRCSELNLRVQIVRVNCRVKLCSQRRADIGGMRCGVPGTEEPSCNVAPILDQ